MTQQDTEQVEEALDSLEETGAPPNATEAEGGPRESAIVDEGSSDEQAEYPSQETPQQESSPEIVDSKALVDRLSALEQQTRDQTMELAYLRGLNQQRQAPQPPPQEEDDDIPDDVFVESLRTNPAATLRSREDRLLKKVERVIEKSLGKFAETRESTDVDTQMMMKRYGAHYDGDPEFKKAVDQTRAVMEKEYGGYKPGLKSTAAAIVFGEFVRMGRIRVTPQEEEVKQQGNGQAPSTQVKETVRRVSADPMVRSQARPLPNKKDPLAGYSIEERKSIQRTCDKLGVTPEQWAAQVANLSKRDPSYGKVA